MPQTPQTPQTPPKHQSAPMPRVARASLSDVVVMHPYRPLRKMLYWALAQAGYRVSEAPTYDAVLCHLRTATAPTVVVAGNWAANHGAEEVFFERVVAEAAPAQRHGFVLVTTIPEWLPAELDATLCSLGVVVLPMPFELRHLLAQVALVARRTPVKVASARE